MWEFRVPLLHGNSHLEPRGHTRAPSVPNLPSAYLPHLCERNESQAPRATQTPPRRPPMCCLWRKQAPAKQRHLPEVIEQTEVGERSGVLTLEPRDSPETEHEASKHRSRRALGMTAPPCRHIPHHGSDLQTASSKLVL